VDEQQAPTAPYVGEFRYVFYAPTAKYQATLIFYRDVLEFPVVGGFSYGTYFQASTGTIEVINDPGTESLRDILFESDTSYQPYRGGFLLVEVEELETLRSRIEGAGHQLIQEPREWPWRFEDFKVEDPCGNLLCFFVRLPGWETHHS